ncbi:lmo0937 family membrane protein [Paenibacillus sp. HB172176]|nr:lmo0937 family membrane protein [Paenibacillus sp. HB172176]
MIWSVIVLLIVLWALGFGFHIAGGLIHLLLVIALIALIFNLVAGRRR